MKPCIIYTRSGINTVLPKDSRGPKWYTICYIICKSIFNVYYIFYLGNIIMKIILSCDI